MIESEIEIETERLRLRMFGPGDLDQLCRIWGDPEVTRFINGGEPFPRERVEGFITRSRQFWREKGFGQLAMIRQDSGELIGYCGFKFLEDTVEVELLYGLAKEHWNQSLTTEAARACLRYAFEETGLERIVAVAQQENRGSLRVMEKVGMKFEKEAHFYNVDLLYYAILREEFRTGGTTYILRAA